MFLFQIWLSGIGTVGQIEAWAGDEALVPNLVHESNICIYSSWGWLVPVSWILIQWALMSALLERSVLPWPWWGIPGASSCWDVGASHHSPLSFAWALCISSWRVTTVQWSPRCMCYSKPRGAHCRFWEQSSPWPAGNLTPSPWSQLQGDAVGWIPAQVPAWRQQCREVLVWLLLAWNFFQALIWTRHPKIPAIPSNYGSSGITDLKGLTCVCA